MLKSKSLSHKQLFGTEKKTNESPHICVKELLSCHLIQTYHNMKSGNPMSNFVGPICFHDQLFWSHGLPCPTCLIPYFPYSNVHPNVWSLMFPCLCFGPTCFHVQLVGLIFSHVQFVSPIFFHVQLFWSIPVNAVF